MKQTEFTIIGGGIAGLTTAIALQQTGIKAAVFEAAPVIRPVGAGLVLAANAMKAYQHLGIAEEIIRAGTRLKQFSIYNEHGRMISHTDSEKPSLKYGINNFTIHRAELHRVLGSRLEPGQIRLGKRAIDIVPDADGYRVLFEDNREHYTKYLIVADGIHSPIRKKLLPQSRIRYSGYTCWRGIADNRRLQVRESSETWGLKGRFGIAPLAGDIIYWYACINAPQNNPAFRNYTVEDLHHLFKDFHEPVGEIILQTRKDQLIWDDICDLEPIGQFAFGNLVLIGDAAHATTPNLGQGACQAIEDAVMLAADLKSHSMVADAFRSFEQKRMKRTRRIVELSWQMGKIAQTENPMLAGIRNTLFRLMPAAVNERQLKMLYEVEF
ncbi:FAD-dependent monooxygenase [Flavihumibacter stibioxidans]|uniref:Monooxygenase n=1 Tax=Flavihumibacter stibioxidans TaxID=1834163 RepID=A0ABR7MDA1_9BACT|nr:FAD-dependent monooxygenase [Flavihumibacter stibioxidans]MBC6493002.1 monooxygenase [Flavihumibacter stibioxidans]